MIWKWYIFVLNSVQGLIYCRKRGSKNYKTEFFSRHLLDSHQSVLRMVLSSLLSSRWAGWIRINRQGMNYYAWDIGIKVREVRPFAALDCICKYEVFLDQEKRKCSKARSVGPGFNEARNSGGGHWKPKTGKAVAPDVISVKVQKCREIKFFSAH